MMRTGLALLTVVLLWGCGELGTTPKASTSPRPKDGMLALPGNYMVWPTFLSDVQRPDVKQVRELFINSVGAETAAGRTFPNGTVMVMELYKAKMAGEIPETGADGKLLKGDLAKIFVMGKGEGWGARGSRRPEKRQLGVFGLRSRR